MPTPSDSKLTWFSIALPFVPVAAFLMAVFGVWVSGGSSAELAGWLAAVAATFALLAATIAALFAWRAFELATAREDRHLETLERAQASQVAAWAGTELGAAGVWVRNASDLPVTGCLVEVTVYWRSEAGAQHRVLGAMEIGLVAPAAGALFLPYPEHLEAGRAALQDSVARDASGFSPDVAVEFRDARGVLWHRAGDGGLEPVG